MLHQVSKTERRSWPRRHVVLLTVINDSHRTIDVFKLTSPALLLNCYLTKTHFVLYTCNEYRDMGSCPPGRMRLSFLQTAKVTRDPENCAQLFIARGRLLVPFKRFHFINSLFSLTSGPQPLPKQVLHRVRSIASSFTFNYPFFHLRSSNSCLPLLSRLPVTCILSILSFIQQRVSEGSFYARCDQSS